MKDNRMKDALENIARRGVPENTNLWPRIEARLDKRSSFMQTLRARPMILIVIVLLALSLLTGVVYAIGKSLGYIPGVGIIDQSAPLRALAEPVSQTRDGVTLTVTGAMLSADKTVLFVKVEGIPGDAYPKDESPGCIMVATILSLADGTVLEGSSIGWSGLTAFENRLEYGAVPANVNEAVLLATCIGGTIPGTLPENWEFPLRFVPAPPDMTVAPVIELSTPAADATSASESPNSMMLNGITLTLEKFVEVEGGYQLYGSLDLSKLPQGYMGGPLMMSPLIMTDANGNQIPFEEVQLEPQNNTFYDPNKVSWVYRTNQRAFAGPLTISLSSIEMQQSTSQIPFELDLGPNPQIGQTWEINHDVDLDGHVVRLLSARLEASNRAEWMSMLTFAYEDTGGNVVVMLTDDDPQTSLSGGGSAGSGWGGGGGGSGGPAGSKFFASFYYGGIPNGLRHFTLGAQIPYFVSGPWQVFWNPPVTSQP